MVDEPLIHSRSIGDQVADRITALIGSWKFVVFQSAFFTLWIAANALGVWLEWDPYPFVFLNLFMSAEATYATPLILMAQNRQAAADRQTIQADLATDLRIEALQAELARIEQSKLDEILRRCDATLLLLRLFPDGIPR
jgi:uncharacterized membrane protein